MKVWQKVYSQRVTMGQKLRKPITAKMWKALRYASQYGAITDYRGHRADEFYEGGTVDLFKVAHIASTPEDDIWRLIEYYNRSTAQTTEIYQSIDWKDDL